MFELYQVSSFPSMSGPASLSGVIYVFPPLKFLQTPESTLDWYNWNSQRLICP